MSLQAPLCYADARVTFTTYPLPDDVYERIKAIPGCNPWEPMGRRTSWTAPYSASWLVAQELSRIGVQYGVSVPHVVPLLDVHDAQTVAQVKADLQARCLERGLHPWVFVDFVKQFQLLCAAFAWTRNRSIVLSEPGSGKTLISILAAVASPSPAILVVTPSGVVDQAVREWRRFTTLDVLELRPASNRRKTDPDLATFVRSTARPVVVVGWGALTSLYDEIAAVFSHYARRPFVVFDESHKAKDRKRQTWTVGDDGKLQGQDTGNVSAVAAKIAGMSSGVVCTTATAIANALIDLWGQLSLVERTGWWQTATAFGKRYCDAHKAEFGWVWSGQSEAYREELLKRMAFSTISIPYEVSHAELPPKRRMVVHVRPEDQIKEATGHGKEIRAAQRDMETEAGSRRVAELLLLQACSRKRPAVVNTVRDYLSLGRGKIIVFSGWRADCEKLGEALRKVAGLDETNVFVSHGEDSLDERNRVKQAYLEHPGPAVLVGTWHAWGTGHNLDDTDVTVFAMLPVTPMQIAQAEGRGDRLSMTRSLLYVYLVASGTIDEHYIDIVMRKLAQVRSVTPGTRLDAVDGGIVRTLSGIDDLDDVTRRVIDMLSKDAETFGWEDA